VVCRLPTEPFIQCAQGGSRTHKHLGLSQAALPSWRTWARVVPDGVEPSLPGCEPGVVPLDHGTAIHLVDSPRVALGFSACGADVFLLDDGPNFDRSLPPCARLLPKQPCSVASSGGWNRTNVLLVQSQASLPTATAPECLFAFSSGRRVRTSVS
jgi:hypothetical protein